MICNRMIVRQKKITSNDVGGTIITPSGRSAMYYSVISTGALGATLSVGTGVAEVDGAGDRVVVGSTAGLGLASIKMSVRLRVGRVP